MPHEGHLSPASPAKLSYFGINFTRRPQKHSKTILFRHLNNATSLILVQFPPSQKLPGAFILAAAERGTLSGNRCSGCLMLACGGPAGLETWSNRDPILEDPQHTLPPSSFLSDEAARCQKYTQLCWIKHLTHWLPDWWWDRRSHPGDGGVWDSLHLYPQLITQDNEKVSVKSAEAMRLSLDCCCCGWRRELSCRLWCWIWLCSCNTVTWAGCAGECLVCQKAQTWCSCLTQMSIV